MVDPFLKFLTAAFTTRPPCGVLRVNCWQLTGRFICLTSVCRVNTPVVPSTHPSSQDIPGKMTFKESDALSPGNNFTTFSTPWCEVGLGICYDIRFAELAQVYSQQMGCKLLVYPGAFNMTTGKAGMFTRPPGYFLLQVPRTGSCWPGPGPLITRCGWPPPALPGTRRPPMWPGVTPPLSAPGARSWPRQRRRRTSSWRRLTSSILTRSGSKSPSASRREMICTKFSVILKSLKESTLHTSLTQRKLQRPLMWMSLVRRQLSVGVGSLQSFPFVTELMGNTIKLVETIWDP